MTTASFSDIRELSSLEFPDFLGLTFPAYRAWALGSSRDSTRLAVGLSCEGRPSGLVLISIATDRSEATLLSIYVRDELRRKGIGAALLARAETLLLALGCRRMTTVYVSGTRSTGAFEALLRSRGWEAPMPRMLVCKTDKRMSCSRFFTPPLFDRFVGSIKNAEIVPWGSLTREDRESIQRRQDESPWIPDDLVPFLYEANFEPINSLALKMGGEVVGWNITHRLGPEVIRYTCSYARADLARRGAIILLYRRATLDQIDAMPGDPIAIWTVPFHHGRMVEFVRNRMGPWMTSIEESRQSSIILG